MKKYIYKYNAKIADGTLFEWGSDTPSFVQAIDWMFLEDLETLEELKRTENADGCSISLTAREIHEVADVAKMKMLVPLRG